MQTFHCVPQTKHLLTADSFSLLQASIDCQQPTPDLYQFLGRINIFVSDGDEAVTVPLGPENVLLRGVRLKNTDFVYGTLS
jgi:hypothetical protein